MCELLRKGTVYEVYLRQNGEGWGGKCIEKRLANPSALARKRFISELFVLEKVRGRPGYCQLLSWGKDVLREAYIPHREDVELRECLEEQGTMRQELKRLLCEYSLIDVTGAPGALRDDFRRRTVKAFVKSCLQGSYTPKMLVASLLTVLYLPLAPWSSPALFHNDSHSAAFLVGEDGRELTLIDFDRATVGRIFLERDPLLLFLSEKKIQEWAWEYEVLLPFYIRGGSRAHAFYHCCVAILLTYGYYEGRKREIMRENFEWILRKGNRRIMEDRLEEARGRGESP